MILVHDSLSLLCKDCRIDYSTVLFFCIKQGNMILSVGCISVAISSLSQHFTKRYDNEQRRRCRAMILISEFDFRRNESFNVYLETFPYRVYDSDFTFIIDNAFEYIIYDWIKSIERETVTLYKNDLQAFQFGENFWITDTNNEKHLLNKEKLASGIGQALKIFKEDMVNYKQEIKAPCINGAICDYIIQISIYGELRFDNHN